MEVRAPTSYLLPMGAPLQPPCFTYIPNLGLCAMFPTLGDGLPLVTRIEPFIPIVSQYESHDICWLDY